MSYTIQIDRSGILLTNRNIWIENAVDLFLDKSNNAILADIQGFYIGKQFMPKELSYTMDGVKIITVLIKSSVNFSNLTTEEKENVRWLEKMFHAIKYASGDVPIEELIDILPGNIDNIIVKGNQKEEFFKQMFPNSNVINLDNDSNCVNLVRTHHDCKNHIRKNSMCTKVNIRKLLKYLLLI